MIKINSDDFCDIDLYSERISKRGYLYYDREELDLKNKFLEARTVTYKNLATMTMIHRSGLRQCNLSKDGIYNYLTGSEYCPDHYFFTKKAEGISIDAKKVLSKVYANGYGKEFIEYYTDYRSQLLKCSKVNSIISKCRTACGETRDGRQLYQLPFEVNPQVNLRFNYRNFDVIGQLPKDLASVLKVPKGYCLAWGDFAQSDFRIAYNLFLRSPENDAIMNKYDDKYEALARIIANTMGKRFNYEEFKRDRKLYKVWILATMYGTRNSLVPEETAFIKTLTEFLMKYAEYYSRLESRSELGLPIIVSSYFGYEQSIPVLYDKASMINTALNTPIQTGTSEIIIYTVNRILDMFYERGWTEDDIGIYLVRHDEPIFWMKEEVLQDAWIFNQFKQILVDDWVPLQLDFDYGYAYKIVDDELTAQVKKVTTDNVDKIDIIMPGTETKTDYFPVADILKLQIAWKPVADKTIVTIYNEKLNQASFMCLDTLDEEKIKFAVRSKLVKSAKQITEAGYSGVLVFSTDLEGEDRADFQYFRYKINRTASINKVHILCRYMICRYCKSLGIQSPVDPPFESDAVWIREVKDMEMFK